MSTQVSEICEGHLVRVDFRAYSRTMHNLMLLFKQYDNLPLKIEAGIVIRVWRGLLFPETLMEIFHDDHVFTLPVNDKTEGIEVVQ